jgi:hypothetical protein
MISINKYTHEPTVLFFKIDLNKEMRYFHIDFCLFGKGVEVMIY